jgi:hypothetical protein
MKPKQPAPDRSDTSDADKCPPGTPPEVWAEFQAQLDEYIEDWKRAMRERFVDRDAGKKPRSKG